MRVIDWFSGIGGFRLGLEPLGFEFVAHSEIDEYAEKIYRKHWPECRNLGDIRLVRGEAIPEAELWVAGFPCEDIARCGKREGISGEKSGLWHRLSRLIRETNPRLILLENSTSIAVRGLETVCRDLASYGYDLEWDRIQAGTFGAPHPRARLYVLAYPSSGRHKPSQIPIFAGRPRSQFHAWWASEPDVLRVDDGVSCGVDRRRCLGNAVVPQVVRWIGEKILKST